MTALPAPRPDRPDLATCAVATAVDVRAELERPTRG
jgi:hypothetical protein